MGRLIERKSRDDWGRVGKLKRAGAGEVKMYPGGIIDVKQAETWQFSLADKVFGGDLHFNAELHQLQQKVYQQFQDMCVIRPRED